MHIEKKKQKKNKKNKYNNKINIEEKRMNKADDYFNVLYKMAIKKKLASILHYLNANC